MSNDNNTDNITRQYELILQSMEEGVYGVDVDGNATFVNAAAEKLTGWDADELAGKLIHGFHHHTKADGSHYPASHCPVYATTSDGEVRHVKGEVFWRKDGTCFPVEYVATPIRHQARIIGTVIVFNDVTERLERESALEDALAQVQQLKERLQQENTYLKEEIQASHAQSGILGQSSALVTVLEQVHHVAMTEATVFIRGESGTGKEMIARAIHHGSRRNEKPLVKINCGALAPSLVESELFGHEKGAFTGAAQKRVGRFELADGGTLFLDEVGELPLDLQVKLLRVLQEGEFERVGSSHTRSVDVRVIAATNRNIEQMVSDRLFRDDLYYRLSVFPIKVPALRYRTADIPLLAQNFVARFSRKHGKHIQELADDAMAKLVAYSWPGNVRELQNVIERGVILENSRKLRAPNLAISADIAPTPAASVGSATVLTMAEAERAHIESVLTRCHGVVAGKQGAAAMLDLAPSTLRSRMKKLGVYR
ncbi:Formate hydrogenlyase transcriptional activator FhlA [BD1-7 clade bacterium]|nr:Formate hydrogenlyase transcriptional activator FhlA [BD1-7 clade bacterium]